MGDIAPEECCMAKAIRRRPHPGALTPIEYYGGSTFYYCETCAPDAESGAENGAFAFDPEANPLSEDELDAAVQALGELTGVQAGDLSGRHARGEGSAAERQVWRRAVNDYHAGLRARGEALIKDLVIGATYRVRYWDPNRMPERGGGSLNLTANALTAAAAVIQNVVHEFRGDVITGELTGKHWNVIHIGNRQGLLTKKMYETMIYTQTIESIESA